MELVTVIIPVYKTREYLEEGVDSVRNQTYKNLEIILVDDGSPDDCGQICDSIAEIDDRVHVIHQHNAGLSVARNVALDIMQGDYVTFVDSDDTIAPNMIEYLLDDLKKYNADIAECQLASVQKNRIEYSSILSETKVYNREQALLMDLSSKGGSVAACGKLYKNKIFDTHRFEDGRFGEDTFAIIGSIRGAESIVIDHRSLYYYNHRSDSITTSEFSERTLDAITGARRNLDIVSREFPGAIAGAMFRLDWSYLWVIDRIMVSSNWYENKYLDELIGHVRTNLKRILTSPYLTRNRKIEAVMLIVSPALYRRLVLYIWRRNWK